MGSGSKLNSPSGVPSEMCPSETLEGDVLGVVVFGFVGWGALTFGGGEMGEFCNCVVVEFVVVLTKEKTL